MKKIYFITRTFVEPEQGRSCVLLNNVYVDLLRQHFHVIVVTPSYDSEDKITEDYIKIRYDNKLLTPYMERVGFLEDYLKAWGDKTLKVLGEIVDSRDIVFATSGGELECIKIASLLKRKKGCKFVINFRDPVSYSHIDGEKIGGRWHVSRERAILEYISNVDYVITTSDKFREILSDKYPFLQNKVVNNYCGYIDEYKGNINHLEQFKARMAASERIKLVFGGSMNKPQGAEYFTHLLKKRDDIEITYIGTPSRKIIRAAKMDNVTSLQSMSHDDYLRYVTENADIGLVSLASEPYKACFPSKIFEYINLEIPILAALPDGDAKRVINEKGYGRAVEYGNMEALNQALDYILDHYDSIVKNIQKDKKDWAMKRTIVEAIELLQRI